MNYYFGQMDMGPVYAKSSLNIIEWFAMGLMAILLLVALVIISVALWLMER
jgi:hypothetical protein